MSFLFILHCFYFENSTFNYSQNSSYRIHRSETRYSIFYRHTAYLETISLRFFALCRGIYHILHFSFMDKVYQIHFLFGDFVTYFGAYTVLVEISLNLLANSTASALSLSDTVKRIAPWVGTFLPAPISPL